MKLYFHIGLNKAGSSYIQDLLSYNYKYLLDRNLYYPNPVLSHGIGGSTSGGNAGDFSIFLGDGDKRRSNSFLRRVKFEAEKNNANAIVLSSEFMYHELIKEETSLLFKKLCEANKITEIRLLIIFRDPVSHSISAFTHRSGSHPILSFYQWWDNGIEYIGKNYQEGVTGYEFCKELPLFLRNLSKDKDYKIQVETFTFDLIKVLDDFLGLQGIKPMPKEFSNISVNCVEAEILRILFKKNRSYAVSLRINLKELLREDKASDGYLRNNYEKYAFQSLAKLDQELSDLQDMLDAGSLIAPPKIRETELFDDKGNPHFLLSAAQVGVLIQTIENEARLSKRGINTLRRYSKKFLPQPVKNIVLKFLDHVLKFLR